MYFYGLILTVSVCLLMVQLRIVIGTQLLFRAGCDSRGENCVINDVKDGRQSSDVRGTLVFPDTDGDSVPDRSDSCPFTPNVMCASLEGRDFQVSAAEGCGASSMHSVISPSATAR